MKLVKAQKKSEPVIPVVSMSDIAFLLIIFFLVTTNFVKESHIRLKLPKADQGKKEDKIQNSVSVDKDGTVWLNGRKTESLKSDLGAVLTNKTEAYQRKVFLKCDKDLKQADFMPVIEQMNEAGAILVLKTDEKSKADLAREKASPAKKESAESAESKQPKAPEKGEKPEKPNRQKKEPSETSKPPGE